VEGHLQSLVAYLSAHPALALGAVFAAAFLEALAVVGTLIPGSSVVFAGGILVGLKALDPWFAGACAVTGAILGDSASYWIGDRYRDALRAVWPLKRYPRLFARGEAYFAKHGAASVFLGRFLSPIRAIVPIVAGMSGMPAGAFYRMNVLSAFAWAAAHMLPGMLFGASLQLAGAVSSRLVVVVAVLVAGVWLVAHVTRLAIHYGSPLVAWMRDRVVAGARDRRGIVSRAVLALLDPARRETGVLLVSAIVLIGAAWLFMGIVEDVLSGDPLVSFDRTVYDALQAVRTGWGDNVMVAITEFGSAYVIVPVIAVVSLWLAVTRRFRTLGYWISAIVFSSLTVLALKYSIGRVRPMHDNAMIDALSFPSGHAAVAMVVYGFLASLVARGKAGWQKAVITVGTAIPILLIAFSRIYLGVHWFSDVAASLALGLAWIALLTIAYATHVQERPLRAMPVLLMVAVTVAVSGGLYAGRDHARDLARYAKLPATRTLAFDTWKDGGWRSVAAARTEIAGRVDEPFRVQWVAGAGSIGRVLESAGWESPELWWSKAALLWLLPATPIDALPVLTKFHRGEPQALTFVYPLGARERVVARLWRVADVVGPGVNTRRSLWVAMITTERLESVYGLMATTRTRGDFVAPLQLFARAVKGEHSEEVARPDRGESVLLVW
jgi:undecaprenyl-diphosphatase